MGTINVPLNMSLVYTNYGCVFINIGSCLQTELIIAFFALNSENV